MESGREEVVLVALLLVVLLVQSSLVFFQVFVELVLAAQLVPPSEMVDFHVGEHSVPLEHPVDLFLLAPDEVPVIIPGLSPLPVGQCVVDTVLKTGFELNVGASWGQEYGGLG